MKKLSVVERRKAEIFENEFWKNYPPRKGVRAGKKKALRLFLLMSIPHIAELMESFFKYKKFIKQCERWPVDADRFVRGYWKEWSAEQVEEKPKESTTPYQELP